MSVVTGRPEKIDVPRSPRTMRPSQSADLGVERLVEAELGADARDVVAGRVVAGDDDGRIARRDVQEREDRDGHHAHDGDGGQQAPQDLGEHSQCSLAI